MKTYIFKKDVRLNSGIVIPKSRKVFVVFSNDTWCSGETKDGVRFMVPKNVLQEVRK